MAQLTANGINIEYESLGNPEHETVLLIMGLGTQLTAWPDSFCENLVARGYHVLRFDNRDVGLSSRFADDRPPSIPGLVIMNKLRLPVRVPYRLTDMVDDAAALLDALSINRAHVVGASMGGMIAQLFAVRFPERALSLTSIMSTTGHRSLPGADRAATKALMLQPADPDDLQSIIERNVTVRRTLQSPRYPKDDEELRDSAEKALKRGGYHPEGVARQLGAIIVAKDRRQWLSEVQIPALVIHGDADPLVKLECGVDTAKHLANSQLKVFAGMAHDLPAELLEPMADLIHATAARA